MGLSPGRARITPLGGARGCPGSAQVTVDATFEPGQAIGQAFSYIEQAKRPLHFF